MQSKLESRPKDFEELEDSKEFKAWIKKLEKMTKTNVIDRFG
jgi:hypothetical protein